MVSMRIKTMFWKNEDIGIWRERVNKIMWYMGIFSLANIVYNIFSNNSILLYITSIVPYITALMAVLSYNKFIRKEKEGENGNK